MPRKVEGSLTKAQQTFCQRLVENGYQYREAYSYAYPNANKETAHRNSYRLGKKPEIQAYIAQLQEEALKMAAISPARMARKLGEIAFADKDDEIYTTKDKLKAMELLQKQMGLDKKIINAKVEAAVQIIDDVPEED